MKTTLGLLLGSLVLSSAAFADAPDFVGGTPPRHIDRSLVASDQTTPIDPADVVTFAFDKTTPTADGFYQIATAARWLRMHPEHKLVIEGHTDRVGSEAYNEDLAARRLSIVRGCLRLHGVSGDRVVLVNYGEREAIAPENPNDRRVVMYVTNKSPEAVIAATLRQRDAVVATWTDNGVRMQLRRGETEPVRTFITRR